MDKRPSLDNLKTGGSGPQYLCFLSHDRGFPYKQVLANKDTSPFLHCFVVVVVVVIVIKAVVVVFVMVVWVHMNHHSYHLFTFYS